MELSVIKSEKTKEKAASEKISEKQKEKDKKEIYQIYYDFTIEINKIKPYQILALNSGEKENAFERFRLNSNSPTMHKRNKK